MSDRQRQRALRDCAQAARHVLAGDPPTSRAVLDAGWEALCSAVIQRVLPLGATPCERRLPASPESSAISALLAVPALVDAWREPTTLGWLYQHFYEAERAAVTRPQSARTKPRREDIPLATQVFTPVWIARALAENTIGRWWLAMHPDSRLRLRLTSLLPCEAVPAEPLRSVRSLRILDLGCGAGHLALAAFDVLVLLYAEELERCGEAGWPSDAPIACADEIPAAILTDNIIGCDADARVLDVAAWALRLRARDGQRGGPTPEPRLIRADVLADTGLRDELPPSGFDVVLSNPPYLDRRALPTELAGVVDAHWRAGGRNLYGAFLLRALGLLRPGGRVGFVTPHTFMFLESYAALRRTVRSQAAVETLVHTGYGTFEGAEVDCAFYTLRAEPSAEIRATTTGTYVRLVDAGDAVAKREAFEAAARAADGNPLVYRCRQTDFDVLPGAPWVYWTSPEVRASFRRLPVLSTRATVAVGLQTGDNTRFLRYWWEVGAERIADGCGSRAEALASGKRWFPHMKGGAFTRWWGNQEYVVNWAADGAEIRSLGSEGGKLASRAQNMHLYFRPGVTWTHTSRKGLSARLLPAGFICNVEGVAAFPRDDSASAEVLLALLNSPVAAHLIGLLNPSVHFGTREVTSLPVPDLSVEQTRELATHAGRAIARAREGDAEDELSRDFVAPPQWPDAAAESARREAARAAAEDEINHVVADAYSLPALAAHSLPSTAPRSDSRRELARRWVSWAVGAAFGRYALPGHDALALPDGIGLLCAGHPYDLAWHVERALVAALGGHYAADVIHCATGGGSLAHWLAGEFFAWHVRRYRRRPVYWPLRAPSGIRPLAYVYTHRINATSLARLRGADYLGAWTGARQDEVARLDAALRVIAEAPDERGALAGWCPEPDDGVLINLAPLAELLPVSFTEPRRCWQALARGDLDWSATALRYWPDRVAAACQCNRSLALAHALVR